MLLSNGLFNSFLRIKTFLSKQISIKYTCLCGFVSGLGTAPFNLYFLTFFGIYYLYSILDNLITFKKKFWHLFAFLYTYNMGFLHWNWISTHVDYNQFYWVIPIALFLAPLVLSFFYTPLFILVKFREHISKIIHPSLVVPIGWCLSENIMDLIFPWTIIGYIASENAAILQLSSLFGSCGLSLFILWVTWWIYKKPYFGFSFLSIVLIFGYTRIYLNQTEYVGDELFGIVQPNFPKKEMWHKGIGFKEFETINLMIRNDNKEEKYKDKILCNICHEGILNNRWENYKEVCDFLFDGVTSDLIIGGTDYESSDDDIKKNDDDYIKRKAYNTSRHFKLVKNGSAQEMKHINSYHKRFLLIFGEYFPRWIFNPFPILDRATDGLSKGGFESGKEMVQFRIGKYVFSNIICFDSVSPFGIFDSEHKTSDGIVNITNDGWFLNTNATYQHMQLCIVRSVETGLPTLRSANTGISFVCDPVGRIIQKSSYGEKKHIITRLPKKLKHTIFSKYFYWKFSWLVFAMFLLFISLFSEYIIKKRRHFV
jgi:apolipoprotein N-acyltransferase